MHMIWRICRFGEKITMAELSFGILGALLGLAFAFYLSRKGVRHFKGGNKILGGFIVLMSVQFFLFPIWMIIVLLTENI